MGVYTIVISLAATEFRALGTAHLSTALAIFPTGEFKLFNVSSTVGLNLVLVRFSLFLTRVWNRNVLYLPLTPPKNSVL